MKQNLTELSAPLEIGHTSQHCIFRSVISFGLFKLLDTKFTSYSVFSTIYLFKGRSQKAKPAKTFLAVFFLAVFIISYSLLSS